MSFREYLKAGALGVGLLFTFAICMASLVLIPAGQSLSVFWRRLLWPDLGFLTSGFLTCVIWRRRLGPSLVRAVIRTSLIAAFVIGPHTVLSLAYRWVWYSISPTDLRLWMPRVLVFAGIWVLGAGFAVVIRRVDHRGGHEPSPRGEVSERRPVNEGPAP